MNELDKPLDVPSLLNFLSSKRPIFHSEADFQHALAWLLHEQFPNAKIRLEYPVMLSNRRAYVDIVMQRSNIVIAIELKYMTRAFSQPVGINNEIFALRSQSARDIGRYDFIKDICRLEELVAKNENLIGIAILLTNDSAYWLSPRNISYKTICDDFRIDEGKLLSGVRRWGERAGNGTVKGRESALAIRGQYRVTWDDYSQVDSGSYGRFRYIAIQVAPTDNPES